MKTDLITKRIWCLLLSLCLCVGMVVPALAAGIVASGTCGDNLTWTLDDTGTLTISGTGNMSSFFVDRIGAPPWYRANIKTLNIQSGVTSIGRMAFYTCSGLTSVTIPDSVSNIGSYAFYGCSNLTSITIPDGVSSIGDSTFSGCSNLTSIKIPDSVTSIGEEAFLQCSALTSVTIPSSVTSINAHAFSGCSNLASITIPSGVTSISERAFHYCSGLTSVTILSGVTSIIYCAFLGCSGLKSITIPSSVTKIESSVFYGCSSLTDVYYGGTEAQWNAVTIESSNEPLTKARIHYNSSGSEPIPAYAFPSAPTVSGGASITRANVGTLTQITVPVAYSGDTAQTVTFAVPFYDGSGKFIGVGMKTETVTSSTQSVTVPVSGLSGSESMKVIILGDNFDPLSPAGSYNIPA